MIAKYTIAKYTTKIWPLYRLQSGSPKIEYWVGGMKTSQDRIVKNKIVQNKTLYYNIA